MAVSPQAPQRLCTQPAFLLPAAFRKANVEALLEGWGEIGRPPILPRKHSVSLASVLVIS